MKKEVGLLLIGVTLGIAFTKTTQRPSQPALEVESHVANPPNKPVDTQEPVAKVLLPLKVIEPIKEAQVERKIESKQVTPTLEVFHPVSAPKDLKTTISEQTLGQLETQIEELRNSIYSETTETGWRIHVLQNDNLLTQNGVLDGDVITFESLEAQRSDPNRVKLVNRMERLLNRIRR